MEGLKALALDVPGDTFEPLIDRHASALRLAHYPPIEDAGLAAGHFRAGAYIDDGTLTVLWTDGEPGLQVLHPNDGWVDVESIDGGVHREPGRPHGEVDQRPVALDDASGGGSGNRASIVDPVLSQRQLGRWRSIASWNTTSVRRYPPTTAGRHLREKFRSTQ